MLLESLEFDTDGFQSITEDNDEKVLGTLVTIGDNGHGYLRPPPPILVARAHLETYVSHLRDEAPDVQAGFGATPRGRGCSTTQGARGSTQGESSGVLLAMRTRIEEIRSTRLVEFTWRDLT